MATGLFLTSMAQVHLKLRRPSFYIQKPYSRYARDQIVSVMTMDFVICELKPGETLMYKLYVMAIEPNDKFDEYTFELFEEAKYIVETDLLELQTRYPDLSIVPSGAMRRTHTSSTPLLTKMDRLMRLAALPVMRSNMYHRPLVKPGPAILKTNLYSDIFRPCRAI